MFCCLGAKEKHDSLYHTQGSMTVSVEATWPGSNSHLCCWSAISCRQAEWPRVVWHNSLPLLSCLQVSPLQRNHFYLTAMEQVKHGLVHCRKLRYHDTTGRLTYFMHPCSNLIARLWGIELPCASRSPLHTHTHTHAHRTNTLMCKNDEDFLAKLFCVRLAFDELMESQANKNYFTQIGRDIMSSFLRSTNQVFLSLSFLLLSSSLLLSPFPLLLSCLILILTNLLKSETKRLC